MILKPFRYHRPSTLKEAWQIFQASRRAQFLAGGTLVLSFLQKAKNPPEDLIGLSQIAGLRALTLREDQLAIGAMTTISELLDSDPLRQMFPSLWQACRSLATTPIRNMATVGGNVASRFSWVDLPCVLISLGAEVVIFGAEGKERLSLSDFLTRPPTQKILTEILILKKKRTSFYFRHTRTMPVDLPFLALAFSVLEDAGRLKDARLIVNTAISPPVELKKTGAVFEARAARRLSLESFREALSADLEGVAFTGIQPKLLMADLEDLLDKLQGRDEKN